MKCRGELKLCAFFSMTLLILLGCSGCYSKNPIEKRTHIQLAISDDPPKLDSRKATDQTSGAILQLCQDTLMRMGADGAPECSLAEKFTISEDGLTYRFHIRPNAKWSNGDSITAFDFEYAWKSVLDPDFVNGDYAYELYCIKNARLVKDRQVPMGKLGVRVEQDLILIVELEKPTPYFLNLISFHTFCPVHHTIGKRNQRWADAAGDDYVCSGPYRLAQWNRNDKLVLEKNPHFWNADSIKIDMVNISIIKDSNTCLDLFQSGDIDLMGSSPFGELPPEAVKSLQCTDAFKSSNATISFWFVLNVEHPLLRNKNIRKALSLAINRQAIAKNVVPGLYEETTHILPAALRRNQADLFEDGNLELARAHFESGLSESGLTRQELNELCLLTDIKSSNKKILQAIQQQWRNAFGIEVKLEQLDKKVFLNKFHSRDFSIARSQWCADYFDPANFLEIFKSKDNGNNATGWENTRYVEFLEKASVELNRDQRQKLLEKAEALIVEEAPVIPMFEQINNLLINAKLKGVRQTVLGDLELRDAYFAK